jgi:hypothetical protein
LRLDLLDQQVLDRTGRPIGRVDEVELDLAEDGTASVTAFRLGGAALGHRLDGAVGRAMVGTCQRLAETEASPALSISEVSEWSPRLTLARALAELPNIAGLERWLGVRLVSRIPGGGRARD